MSENWKIYLVNIQALVSIYQINTDKCTHILLNHHFIKTIPNYIMFQPLKCLLQRAQLINYSTVGQQNDHQLQNST